MSNFDYPTVAQQAKLLETRPDLLPRIAEGSVFIAANSAALVAYEPKVAAKAIVLHHVQQLTAEPVVWEEVDAFIKQEGDVWDCPALIAGELPDA